MGSIEAPSEIEPYKVYLKMTAPADNTGQPSFTIEEFENLAKRLKIDCWVKEDLDEKTFVIKAGKVAFNSIASVLLESLKNKRNIV